MYSRPVKPSRKEQDELNAGRSRKSKVGMPDFVAKHRRLANSWIGETAPAAERRHGPTKATWLALSREAAANFKRRHAAFRNMPCMPFDVWLLMKREEEIATDYGHKVESWEVQYERKTYYQRLGRERKLMLLGIPPEESSVLDDEDEED